MSQSSMCRWARLLVANRPPNRHPGVFAPANEMAFVTVAILAEEDKYRRIASRAE